MAVTLLCPAPQPDRRSPLPSLPEASDREQGWKKIQVWGCPGFSGWQKGHLSAIRGLPGVPQGSIKEAPCLPVSPKLRQTLTDVTPMSPTLRSSRQVQGGSTPRVQSEGSIGGTPRPFNFAQGGSMEGTRARHLGKGHDHKVGGPVFLSLALSP